MATRIYLPASGTAAVSPAFDGAWEKTSEADRLECVTTRSNSAFASKTSSENVATSSYDFLTRQYVSKPLAAQSVSGTVKGQIKCLESASTAKFCRALVIKVVSNDGQTLRGTLLSHFPSALTNEYSSSSLTNRFFPPAGTGLGSVSAQSGDRLVIEIGSRSFNTTTANRTATHRFGDASATDLPENETETQDYNPWIEFSQSLIFVSITGTGAAQVSSPGAAASGKHGVKGTGAATAVAAAACGSGAHGVSGMASRTIATPGAAAFGWGAVSGTGAGGSSLAIGLASAHHGVAGPAAINLTSPWATATGIYIIPQVSGTAAAQLAALSAGAWGKHGVAGTAVAASNVPGAAVAGKHGVAGQAAAQAPAGVAGAWGNFGTACFGLGAAAIPAMAADGYGLTGSGQPSIRRLKVELEQRVLQLPGESRFLLMEGESRLLKVSWQDRILLIEAEERILRRVA